MTWGIPQGIKHQLGKNKLAKHTEKACIKMKPELIINICIKILATMLLMEMQVLQLVCNLCQKRSLENINKILETGKKLKAKHHDYTST